MKKFLVLFSAPAATREKMQSATPEEMKAAMQPWMDWFAKVGSALVDRGMPLTNSMALTKDGTEPGNPEYVAFEIVQAEDVDGALAIMKDNPHLQREGGRIEVHEMWDMNGMIK